MHVVLIAYHFPPSPEVGALRAAKVVRALRAGGHRVTVITATLPHEPPSLRVNQPGYTVEAVRPHVHPGDILARWSSRFSARPGTAPANGTSGEPGEVPQTVPGWKRLILSFLWMPDYRQGFIPPAVRSARGAIRRGADLLYTTAPPFSALLAGLWLKWRTGIRWITEFRDPWMDNPWKPAHLRSRPADALGRWLEARCLAASDRVIGVTDLIGETLGTKLGPRRDRLNVIRNGIDQLRPARPQRRSGPYRITYVGSFYHRRDPRPFLEALAAIARRKGLGPDAVQVDFAGHCRTYHEHSIEQEVDRLGLGGLVRFHSWMPHEASRALVEHADLLLLLAQEQPTQVPNKLYEYLGAGVPVLALADDQGETARMLRRAGGHYVITSGKAGAVEQALEAAMAGSLAGSSAPDESVLREWTTDEQMRRWLAIVEERPVTGTRTVADAPGAPTEGSPAGLPTDPLSTSRFRS